MMRYLTKNWQNSFTIYYGYKELSYHTYRRLQIIPKTFIVEEHHQHIYSSKNNDNTIVRAPRSEGLFETGIAMPSLVTSIINGKSNNALPLDLQSRAFKCNGINLQLTPWLTG